MKVNKPNSPVPMRWLDRLLTWLVAPHLREEVLGDLHERYALRVQRLGEAKARRWYWREVLAYVRPAFMKRQPSKSYPTTYILSPDMLRNYFTVAWRNLLRNRALSTINIVGLSTRAGGCHVHPAVCAG